MKNFIKAKTTVAYTFRMCEGNYCTFFHVTADIKTTSVVLRWTVGICWGVPPTDMRTSGCLEWRDLILQKILVNGILIRGRHVSPRITRISQNWRHTKNIRSYKNFQLLLTMLKTSLLPGCNCKVKIYDWNIWGYQQSVYTLNDTRYRQFRGSMAKPKF